MLTYLRKARKGVSQQQQLRELSHAIKKKIFFINLPWLGESLPHSLTLYQTTFSSP
jgi:hypothetical protein